MNITEIEALTEAQAKEMAIETMDIKGHNAYFIDFEGYFGYSVCIFKNGHHIYYANDYELHHRGKDKNELKQMYIEGRNNVLFTEEEILAPITDYDDYTHKEHYLRNYYIQQIDYVSAFCIGNKEQEKLRNKVKDMFYNPISFCYVTETDVPFCKHQAELMAKLELKRAESEKDYDYMKKAFLKEMYNHEYGINWDGDADVLGVFGNIPREITWNSNYTLDDLFNAVGFNDEQKKAYMDAKKEYYKDFAA